MLLRCFPCDKETQHVHEKTQHKIYWKCEACGYRYDRLDFHRHTYWKNYRMNKGNENNNPLG